MMHYKFTDLTADEVKAVKEKGLFVYVLVDTDGVHYSIRRNAWTNRFGHLITDEPLKLDEWGEMTDQEFSKLDGVEDNFIEYGNVNPDADIIRTENGFVHVYTYFEDVDGIYETIVFPCYPNGKGMGSGNYEEYITYDELSSEYCHDEVVNKWRKEPFDNFIEKWKVGA